MCLKRLINLLISKNRSQTKKGEIVDPRKESNVVSIDDGIVPERKVVTSESAYGSLDDAGTSLAYRTIGNEDPHGKSRVFFACHPEDFDIYFEQVKNYLFTYQKNCAIWYVKQNGSLMDDEALRFQLSEMQMIVIPITTKLMT